MIIFSILLVRKGYWGLILSFLLIGMFIAFFFKGTQHPFPEFCPLLYALPILGWMFRFPDINGIFLPFVFMMTLA
jgi:hypothetical protein